MGCIIKNISDWSVLSLSEPIEELDGKKVKNLRIKRVGEDVFLIADY